MRTFNRIFFGFSRPKKAYISFAATLFAVLLLFLCACGGKVNYFDYVSELRSNIFLAEADGFALRIYALKKENPYVSEGAPMEMTTRTEVYLVAPSGDETCNLSFTVDGKAYGGEMSFDNVKAEYYFSCTLDVSTQTQIDCTVSYGKQELSFSARSVLTEDTLTPEKALAGLCREEGELFESMTDKYGFSGEIYVRLLYEDSPYYYVGVIGRDGKTTAFLLNAQTGKILAKRES